MNLTINLATRVYVNFKRVNLALTISFLLCFCWLAFNVYTFFVNLEQMNRYIGSNTGKIRGRAGSVVSDADYTTFLAKVKNVNNILYKRSYDWLSLLDNMEQLVPAGVSLKSLEPLDKGESLRLAGSANGFSSVRRFVENLENSKTFTDIYLTEQASAKIDNQRKVINFTVTCKASIR